MNIYKPSSYTYEPPITPPEPYSVIAGCGCEVYEGETMVEWDDKTLCPDHFRDKINEMDVTELAIHLHCDYTTVSRERR
jgi:hypothetical protein